MSMISYLYINRA